VTYHEDSIIVNVVQQALTTKSTHPSASYHIMPLSAIHAIDWKLHSYLLSNNREPNIPSRYNAQTIKRQTQNNPKKKDL